MMRGVRFNLAKENDLILDLSVVYRMRCGASFRSIASIRLLPTSNRARGGGGDCQGDGKRWGRGEKGMVHFLLRFLRWLHPHRLCGGGGRRGGGVHLLLGGRGMPVGRMVSLSLGSGVRRGGRSKGRDRGGDVRGGGVRGCCLIHGRGSPFRFRGGRKHRHPPRTALSLPMMVVVMLLLPLCPTLADGRAGR